MSIQHKQTLIIMLTSTLSLLLACASFVAYDVSRFRSEILESVSSLAEVVGNGTTAAIDFNDPQAANQALEALRGAPHIEVAHIHTPDGSHFAGYAREGSKLTEEVEKLAYSMEMGHVFTADRLYLVRPILQGSEQVGMIELVANLGHLWDRQLRYVGIAGMVLVTSLLAAYWLSNLLQKLVSGPILHLAQVARSVAIEKNYSVRAIKQSGDELGQLVEGFNEMLEQIQKRDTALQTARDDLERRVEERTRELENIHVQLVDASRLGGMAEIATNILHNVGNVLNSINISADLITQLVKKSRANSLARVVALLQEHEQDLGEFITKDPKGRHVPALLARLSGHFAADQITVNDELESLRSNVEHIKDIVAMQQNYAKVGGLKEMVNVTDLVEDSLRLNEGALNRHGVQVIRKYTKVPPMNVEKHKILQILVNLVRNAKHACDDSDQPDKKLRISVSDSNGNIRISVNDNGIGISEENLTRIFNHGFTTRRDGHGFGLHSGALAAKEMGGSLTAQSDGPGLGSTFILELPHQEKFK